MGGDDDDDDDDDYNDGDAVDDDDDDDVITSGTTTLRLTRRLVRFTELTCVQIFSLDLNFCRGHSMRA